MLRYSRVKNPTLRKGRRLLRPRRKRPSNRRAAEQRDELASSQGLHRLSPPLAAGFPHLSLARRDGLVLGPTLNRSESVGSRRDLTGRSRTFSRSGYPTVTTLAPGKGRLIRCTVPGSTPNRLAM